MFYIYSIFFAQTFLRTKWETLNVIFAHANGLTTLDMVEVFHALATEGNASKYFVAVCASASAMINRDDVHFTIHILRSMCTNVPLTKA